LAKITGGKGKKAKKAASVQAAPALATKEFLGTIAQSISSDEIYHRLEWYFDRSHDPHGVHRIPPDTAISLLLHGLGLEDLYVNINRVSQTYFPAWNSPLFHGVIIPWISAPGIALGIKDVKSMGDLIDCLTKSYQHAGWKVIGF
jgi:hypothetical protein